MNLKELGEFGLISFLTKNSIFKEDNVIVGIGDDTAVLPLDDEYYLLAACDMLVENVHFLRDKSTPWQIGYKSVAVNFSDIAAMGGWPSAILISLGIPADIKVDYLNQLYAGMKCICQKYNVNIIGGDTVASDKLLINISVLGKVKICNLRLRSHAQKEDIVFCTGSLGDSAAGLEVLKLSTQDKKKVPEDISTYLTNKHLCPEPCLNESKVLNVSFGLHSLNDISDGLASEANEIADASDLAIHIYAEKIPISQEARSLSKIITRDPLEWALFGGEDYQLLGTIAKDKYRQLSNYYTEKLGKEIFAIGKVVEGKGVYLLDKSENRSLLPKKGFNHFL